MTISRALFALLLVSSAAHADLAFPSAVGFGAQAQGGRGATQLLIYVSSTSNNISQDYCEPGSTGGTGGGSDAPYYTVGVQTCSTGSQYELASATCGTGFYCIEGALGSYRRALNTSGARDVAGRTYCTGSGAVCTGTLNTQGSCSAGQLCSASSGTMIAFSVGGAIGDADSRISLWPSRFTLFGMSAPGGWYTWGGNKDIGRYTTSPMRDGVIRYDQHYWLGAQTNVPGGCNLDVGPGACAGVGTGAGVNNSIFDHVMYVQASDEIFRIGKGYNITVQNSLFGLGTVQVGTCTGDGKGCRTDSDCSARSAGTCNETNAWDVPEGVNVYYSGDVTLFKNAYTTNFHRNPKFSSTRIGSSTGELRGGEHVNSVTFAGDANDVNYAHSSSYTDLGNNGTTVVDYVKNVLVYSHDDDYFGTCAGGTRGAGGTCGVSACPCGRNDHCPGSSCSLNLNHGAIGNCASGGITVSLYGEDNKVYAQGPDITGTKVICDPAVDTCDGKEPIFRLWNAAGTCNNIGARQARTGILPGEIAVADVEAAVVGASRNTGPNRVSTVKDAIWENSFIERELDYMMTKTTLPGESLCGWYCAAGGSGDCPSECTGGTLGAVIPRNAPPDLTPGVCVSDGTTGCECADLSDGGADGICDATGTECSSGNCHIMSMRGGWSPYLGGWVDTTGAPGSRCALTTGTDANKASTATDADSDDDGLDDCWEDQWWSDLDQTHSDTAATAFPAAGQPIATVATTCTAGTCAADSQLAGTACTTDLDCNPTGHYTLIEVFWYEFIGELTFPGVQPDPAAPTIQGGTVTGGTVR